MKKFQVTITETDKGIEIDYVDFESKQKADLGLIGSNCSVGLLSKHVIAEIQKAHYLAGLISPNKITTSR